MYLVMKAAKMVPVIKGKMAPVLTGKMVMDDNGEDGNSDGREDGSCDVGISMWLLVAYLETETRQPLNYSTLVCRNQTI